MAGEHLGLKHSIVYEQAALASHPGVIGPETLPFDWLFIDLGILKPIFLPSAHHPEIQGDTSLHNFT